MKIAVIRYKYVNYGGAEGFVDQYTNQLASAGHEVHIFAHQWQTDSAPRLQVHPVPAWTFNSFIRSLSFSWFAAREIRKQKFDVVQSHERIFDQDIYRAGDGCHREWLEQRRKFLSPVKRFFLAFNPFHRLILFMEKGMFEKKWCRKIVAISEMVKKDIQKHYRVPDDKITVVYNGVELERFHPKNKKLYRSKIREKLKVPDASVLILFVGSGFERKGLKFLIQSLEFLSSDNWQLLLMGKGNWNRYLGFTSPEKRKKIHCLDPVDDLEQYYAAADIFVLPSIYEPFGNANLEALASGLPVVTSMHSGAAEILEHGKSGMVVENPSDPKEIAEHINPLFDPVVRENMGRHARVLAEKFTQARNIEEMMGVYQEVIGSYKK
ncbi:MAG: glycosyltransferase family 4 protein [Nitrospinae bacterium]|nr:glycosyltransferase family 4 protein [Nitrospinota bacterium]MDA1110790.1 glycosyltransferase family 4 protein [Nitrospinota bacterium]